MNKTQTIENFYKTKLNRIPQDINTTIGHFNVFRLDDFVGTHAKPIPYSRKDYFKISLIIGNNKVHYADKIIEIRKQALFFANPQIPYNWEEIDKHQRGFFCIFTDTFFHHFGNLKNYAVFQPNENPVFELTDEQTEKISAVYEQMFEEINTEYVHKYDLLRNLVFAILHEVMKIHPSPNTKTPLKKASHRISGLFLELLERQFPIEDTRQRLSLRSATDFARQLSIHVNSLNRAMKESTRKTTSEIISERILQEAKVLLKHTTWSISEIAYTLGFTETTHFSNFFKKKLNLTPSQFRNV